MTASGISAPAGSGDIDHPEADSARVLRVAVPAPLRQLFDYRCNPHEQLEAGDLVQAPFGRRMLTGVVIETRAHSEIEALKTAGRHALGISLDNNLVRLLRWCWRYYHHPPGDIIAAALPQAIRRQQPVRCTASVRFALSRSGRRIDAERLARKPAQQALWRLLLDRPRSRGELQQVMPNWRRSWRLLLQQGLVEEVPAAAASPAPLNSGGDWVPGREQRRVLDRLIGDGIGTDYQCVLLDGVTGSGKTLVYIEVARRLLQAGGQALFLVPEIGLVQQLREQLQTRLGVEVWSYHSGLPEGRRARCWLHAHSGAARIVVGTRSGVFLPLPDLRLIVVDEEHDPAYKQFEGAAYHARDVAVKRAHDLDIPVLLGSATPALESLHNAGLGRYRHLRMRQRHADVMMPEWRLLDQRLAQADARHTGAGIIHAEARVEVHSRLESRQQVLVYLNRRGYAPVLQCRSCGWSAVCSRCGSTDQPRHLNWHRRRRRLLCHHCGHEQAEPRLCPQCAAPVLDAIGAGTEKLEQVLERLFAPYPVFRVDSDSMRRRQAMRELRQQVLSGRPCVLAGTQMIGKGHHFPGVSLVVVVDTDQALFSADFRATERLAQQLIQVGGRCGRGGEPGLILLQTHQPEHPLLTRLVRQGYGAVARRLLEERRLAELPPFTHQAVLRCSAPRRAEVLDFLTSARERLPEPDRLQVLGPIPALLERRAGRFRYQLWLQSDERILLHACLHGWIERIDQLAESRRVRWRIDIDPLEM